MKFTIENIAAVLILLFGFLLPFSVATCYMLMGLIIILWFIKSNHRKTVEILKKSQIVRWCLLWLVLHLVGILWIEDFNAIFTTIKKPFYLISIPIFMSLFRLKDIGMAFNTFLLGIFVYHIIVYGVYFEWWTVTNMQVGGTPFINRVQYSPMLVLAMFILYFQQKSWSSPMRILSMLVQLSFLSSLIITEGRTGQLLLFSLVPITIFLETRNWKIFIAGSLLVATFIIALSLFSSTFSSRFDQLQTSWKKFQVGNTYSSLGERLHHLDASVKLFLERPWTGFGTGSYEREHQRLLKTHYPPGTIDSNHPHNQFLLTLVQFGIPGGIILLLLPYIMLRYYIIKPNHQYRNLLILFPLGFFMILLADNFIYSVPLLTTFIYLSSMLYHPDW